MAEAIISLLNDRDRAEKMSIAGRERAEKMFSMEGYVENVERVYNSF